MSIPKNQHPLHDPVADPTSTAPSPSAPPREEAILRFFAYSHLPAHLQVVSEPYFKQAHLLIETLAPSAERSVALWKLLESKDAAVRAALP